MRINRSIQVEGAFGVLKQDMDFRRFLLRGRVKVRTEFLLLCIRRYPIHAEDEVESQVVQAFRDGADVVIGGFITGKAARKYNFPYELINSGAEGILQAAQEAKAVRVDTVTKEE